MSKIRVSRVAIKAEVIAGHGEMNGAAYNVTVGRLSNCEKDELIDALSKVSKSSWTEAECPEGTCWLSISFEMYSKLEDITQPTWVCNDAMLEFETGGYARRRLDLVRIDDFSKGRPMPLWFKTDTADDDEEEEEFEHVTENFNDVGVEVLDVDFDSGLPFYCYWAKIRLFDLTQGEVEKIKRVYERDAESLPMATRCGERLEPGFELEVRPSKGRLGLKEVTVVLYFKNCALFKTVGAYGRDIDLILSRRKRSLCPTVMKMNCRGGVRVLEPRKRFEYRAPADKNDETIEDEEAKETVLRHVAIKVLNTRGNWFKTEEKKIDNEEETAMSEETPNIKEVILNSVAIRVDPPTTGISKARHTCGIVKITIGRLSDEECEGIKKIIATYGVNEYRNIWVGRSKSGACPLHELSFWVHTNSELKNADVVNARIVANSQSMAVEIVDVWSRDRDPFGPLRERDWFGTDLDQTSSYDTYCPRTSADDFKPKKVAYNPPATIVWWEDGTKTAVQAQDGEPYDPEKGLAMAIAKKALGNTRDYYRTFVHWRKRYDKQFPAAGSKEKYVTPPAPKTASKKKSTGKKGGKK